MLDLAYCFGRSTARRIAGVMAWWMLIAGAVAFALPSPTGTGTMLAFEVGHAAHISTPSGARWLIPIDRATYYEVDRPALDEDEDAATGAGARPGWLVVLHGQAARVIDVDRAAVQVELLEDPNIGGQGWLHMEYLRP